MATQQSGPESPLDIVSQPPPQAKLMPFPPDILPMDHMKQLVRIRVCLISWIMAQSDVQEGEGVLEQAEQDLGKATENLADLKIDPPYQFTPTPMQRFRAVLLSITKCYWMALLRSLNAEGKQELKQRLDVVPSHENRIPKFDGEKCVGSPAELSEVEYEGLMRMTTFVAVGLTSNEIVKMWRELAEVGVQIWEE